MNILFLDGPREGQMMVVDDVVARRGCFDVMHPKELPINALEAHVREKFTYFIHRIEETSDIGFASLRKAPPHKAIADALVGLARNQAERIEKATKLLEKIVCVVEPDAGVVLLSNEGPTRYDPHAGCEEYIHKYFSPLGDALIELHQVLSGERNAK